MAEWDFEVVHGKDPFDQTRNFVSLFLKVSGKRPGELGEHDGVDDARLVRRRGVDKAARAIALCGIVLDEQAQQNVRVEANHPPRPLLLALFACAIVIGFIDRLVEIEPRFAGAKRIGAGKIDDAATLRASSRIDPIRRLARSAVGLQPKRQAPCASHLAR